jgi:hypothetical protein
MRAIFAVKGYALRTHVDIANASRFSSASPRLIAHRRLSTRAIIGSPTIELGRDSGRFERQGLLHHGKCRFLAALIAQSATTDGSE